MTLFATLLVGFSGVGALAQFGSMNRFPSSSPLHSDASTLPGVLEVTVRDSNGVAAQNLPVELRDELRGGLVATGVTGRQGSFDFANLPSGVYDVVATQGANQVRGRVEFRGGSDGIVLRLSASAGAAAGNGATVSLAQMKVPAKAQRELAKAKELMAQGKMAPACARALKAIAIYPDYGEAHAVLGLLNLSEGKRDDAIAELEKAVRLDPNSVLNLAALGAAYNAIHHFDDALRAVQSALRLAPNTWQAHMEMAKAYLGKNDFAAGLRSAEKALALAPPAFAQNHLLRAQALLGLKEYSDAIHEYEQYLSRQPQGPEAAQVRLALDQAKTLAGSAQ
jgi:Tfp pilus assembly protein PilF